MTLASKSLRSPVETRARLLAVATVIFSERGYQGATTRLICEAAQANAAALNYHFGDKLNLYTEVLTAALGKDQAQIDAQALMRMAPEAGLREFVTRLFNSLINFDAQDAHVRLMAYELAQPTPALAIVVEKIIRPRAVLLSTLVARIIGSSPRSLQTRLAAHSIIAQIVHYMHSQPVVELLWPQWRLDKRAKQVIADHIFRFSLAALIEMRTTKQDNSADTVSQRAESRMLRPFRQQG